MQKLKFEAETGAELRQQMLDFLGLDNQSTVHSKFVPLKDFAENPFKEKEVSETKEETKEDTPAPTRKRRTKAELEAEKAAEGAGAPEEDKAEEAIEETKEQETPTLEIKEPETTVGAITKATLTPVVIQKGREGKKEKVAALFGNYLQVDGVSPVVSLPTLDPADYEDFLKELNKL